MISSRPTGGDLTYPRLLYDATGDPVSLLYARGKNVYLARYDKEDESN